MRAIALPDEDSLSVIESSSPGSRKLLRYRVEYSDPENFSSGYNSAVYGAGGEGGGAGGGGDPAGSPGNGPRGPGEYVLHRNPYPHPYYTWSSSSSPAPSYF